VGIALAVDPGAAAVGAGVVDPTADGVTKVAAGVPLHAVMRADATSSTAIVMPTFADMPAIVRAGRLGGPPRADEVCAIRHVSLRPSPGRM
jgi:hypothetical protein